MRRVLSLTAVLLIAGIPGACEQQPTTPEGSLSVAGKGPPGSVLTITAVHEDDQYRYELSDTDIPSGWTTIELENQTQSTHFALLRKPSAAFLEGLKEDGGEISAGALIDAAVRPFQETWNAYFRGDINVVAFGQNLGENFPGWFFKHRPTGGAGLTAGGETSRTTQNLEPGIYFVECYVIGEDGRFHLNGMVEKFVVTDESSGAPEPRPTFRVSVSKTGFEVVDAQEKPGIPPGRHTVAVTFEEQIPSSRLDLHLFRFDDRTSVEELNAWMGYMDVGPDGFYDTDEFGPALTSYHGAPGPQTFLGGVQDIGPPLPETAYFHVQLQPGEYAWVAEIADPEAKGFLETFTVPFSTNTGG